MTLSGLYYRVGLFEGTGTTILILGSSFLGSALFVMETMPDDLWRYVLAGGAVVTTGIVMLVFSYLYKRKALAITDEIQSRIARMQELLTQAKHHDEVIEGLLDALEAAVRFEEAARFEEETE